MSCKHLSQHCSDRYLLFFRCSRWEMVVKSSSIIHPFLGTISFSSFFLVPIFLLSFTKLSVCSRHSRYNLLWRIRLFIWLPRFSKENVEEKKERSNFKMSFFTGEKKEKGKFRKYIKLCFIAKTKRKCTGSLE